MSFLGGEFMGWRVFSEQLDSPRDVLLNEYCVSELLLDVFKLVDDKRPHEMVVDSDLSSSSVADDANISNHFVLFMLELFRLFKLNFFVLLYSMVESMSETLVDSVLKACLSCGVLFVKSKWVAIFE
jgi:hypothetical protein